jgi:hypothetical protein
VDIAERYYKHGQLLDAGTIEQAEDSAAQAWLADTLDGRHSQRHEALEPGRVSGQAIVDPTSCERHARRPQSVELWIS